MVDRSRARSRFLLSIVWLTLLVGMVVPSSGCYTIKSLAEPHSPKVYGGVRRHFREQAHIHEEHQNMEFEERSGPKLVIMILDLPLCAVFDTVFLLFTPFLSYDPSGRGPDEFDDEPAAEGHEWEEWR